MPVTITFKDDVTEDISGTLKFSYEDVTAKSKGESSLTFTIPKPSVDIHVVSEQEFNAALAFEGVEYLQEENNSSISEGTKQISPSTYYEKSTIMSILTEQYVYKVKEDIYKKIMCYDSTTDWKNINWESATEQTYALHKWLE